MNSLTKVCNKCKIEKDVSEFYSRGSGYAGQCKSCENKSAQQYRETHREKVRERHRRYEANNKEKLKARRHKYHEENREKTKEAVKRWIAKNPDKWKSDQRKTQLKRNYGITPDEYDGMLRRQGGVCAVCGKPPGKRKLSVDHDHKTRKIRSLLCTCCNMALGYANESPSILQGLIDYLKRHL